MCWKTQPPLSILSSTLQFTRSHPLGLGSESVKHSDALCDFATSLSFQLLRSQLHNVCEWGHQIPCQCHETQKVNLARRVMEDTTSLVCEFHRKVQCIQLPFAHYFIHVYAYVYICNYCFVCFTHIEGNSFSLELGSLLLSFLLCHAVQTFPNTKWGYCFPSCSAHPHDLSTTLFLHLLVRAYAHGAES
jgi:hypothetical protein